MNANKQTNRVDPQLIAVARGDEPADLLLTGGRVVNVFTRTIEESQIAIYGQRIAGVGPDYHIAREVVDLAGAYVSPGLIDAHMHVESTQMRPSDFCRVVVPRGMAGAVFDPHEIANVLGIEGIKFLMEDALGLPMNCFFAASSCVPASPLETSGTTLLAEDLEQLFDEPQIIALAEMMNFPGVVNADPSVLAKVALGISHGIVDGHCPQLRGMGLQAYLSSGISSDHECTTAEEAQEKLAAGMRIYIREGSAAKNLEALLPLVTPANASRFSFCTDDRDPVDLHEEGHLDHVVRKSVRLGLDPATALAMGSLHTAEHYGLRDYGAIAPGRYADLFICDDLKTLRATMVLHHGRVVARDGCLTTDLPAPIAVPKHMLNTVALPKDLSEKSLVVSAPDDLGLIKVIHMMPGQIVTGSLDMTPAVVKGEIVSDTVQDVIKTAVIERHHGTGNIGLAFVHGFGITNGALASTVGHDAHNLAVVGTNDADMICAANALAATQGGQCVVQDGQVLAVVPLTLAGLISVESTSALVEGRRLLAQACEQIGCTLPDPTMALSFMPLSVIPSLKVSDQGLIDVDKFQIVGIAR